MQSPDPHAHILVAEDDANLRLLVVDLLEASGYRVTAVGGTGAAREAFDRTCPDLVLADIGMPEGGGFELLRHIRSRGVVADVPVIFLTGRAGLADVRAGLREGVDDYLTKPFEPAELLRSIQLRLERREQRMRHFAQLTSTMGNALPRDLRNPLTGILGYAQLLRAKAEGSEPIVAADLSEATEAQIAACRRLLWLGEAIRVWAELAAVSPEMIRQYATVRAGPWVARATQQCQEIAAGYARGRDLTMELEEAAVPVPEHHWLMALAQLADNALRFSPEGSTVWIIGKREKGAYRLSVWNEGRCRPEFEIGDKPGGRDLAAPAPGAEAAGGLGLTIVRRVVALSGAEFRLGSAKEGTEAFLVLPGLDRAE
jgi:DNA-binding response OmpR family regulator/two-component sensor histidine kinase